MTTTSLLLRASLDGAIAAGVVWLICRLVPSLPAGARAMLWWCAAAKFVVALAWTTPVPLPVLPARIAELAPRLTVERGPMASAGPTEVSFGASEFFSDEPTPMAWTRVLLAIWITGVAASLIVGLTQWRRARGILRDAAAAPAELDAVVADLAARAGLPQAPPACVSTRVATPLVIGLRRSTIVLPAATFAAMTPAEQRMAISHEIAHIRRGDLRWGCVPALAEALFFFHPLAHVCAREYALWREAACDAAVIETTGVAPEDYAQLLLGLGVTRPRAGLAAAGASESFSNLKRRLVMLHAHTSHSTASRSLAGAVVGLAVLAIVPVRLTARQASAPAAAPAQAPTPAPAPAPAQTLSYTVTTAEGPKTVAFEATPSPQQAPREREAYSYQLRSKEGQPTFVIFRGDTTHFMDGSREDLARARQFRQGEEAMIWVRQDGREYVSRDAELLRKLHEAWRPVTSAIELQNQVSAEQRLITNQQGLLGYRQREIAIEQSKLGVQQSEIGLRQSQLAVTPRGLSETEQRRLEDERVKLQAQLSALSRQIEELTVKMRELERPLRDLSIDMEVRSRDMNRMAAEMQTATAAAERDMRSLIVGAIASGVLQPVK